MKRPVKIVLLAVTLFPFLLMLLFFLSLIGRTVFEMEVSTLDNYANVLGPLSIVWVISMTIYYLLNAMRHPRLSKEMKWFWAVLMLLTNMYSMPIYWCLYIWPEESTV